MAAEIISQAVLVVTIVRGDDGRRAANVRSFGSPEGNGDAEEYLDAVVRLLRSIETDEFKAWVAERSAKGNAETPGEANIRPQGPAIGQRASCRDCGRSILFGGEHWSHEGEPKPRHPAIPALDKPWGVR